MSMSSDEKAEIIKKFAAKPGDTGSPEVQIAILSKRIADLTEHLKTHKKDNHSRRGLMGMVNRRNTLLKYIRGVSHERYKKIVAELNLRAKL